MTPLLYSLACWALLFSSCPRVRAGWPGLLPWLSTLPCSYFIACTNVPGEPPVKLAGGIGKKKRLQLENIGKMMVKKSIEFLF